MASTEDQYSLEQAQEDIATLRGTINNLAEMLPAAANGTDLALLLYASLNQQGPTYYYFQDGTDGWTATNGAVTQSSVWSSQGTDSLLLTANGGGDPSAASPITANPYSAGKTGIPCSPNEPVFVLVDVYVPASLSHVYIGIQWLDAMGNVVSETDCADTAFSAGQEQTLVVAGTAPASGVSSFIVVFGDHHADSSGTLLYADNVRIPGNLLASLSTGGGTDNNGNVYPPGLNLGLPGTGQVNIQPNVNTPFDITSAIAGVFGAMAQFYTADPSEMMPSMFGSVLLNSGTATKMASVMHSPIGTEGAAIVLESQNDGGTDTPVLTLGTVSMPDGMTMVFTPIATFTPYAFLLYGSGGGLTVKSFTSSTTWTAPAGVTSVKSEAWGAGGGGANGWLESSGAGGEYAAELTNTVVPSDVYTVTVGTGGSGGAAASGSNPGSAGGNSSFSGTSATTVTAHGGGGGTNSGATGGTGSSNSVHNNGGAGAIAGSNDGGSGGGGSGGTSSAGNSGNYGGGGNAGAAGATAVTGGGAGGKGGNGSNTTGATAGAAGGSPGGGGGGGGFNAGPFTGAAGGAGASGMVRLTYTVTAPTILASIAAAGGSDQFGNSYSAGVTLPGAVEATGGTASTPTLITTDSWHSLGTLTGATVNIAQYRLMPTGMVHVDIDITFGSSTAESTLTFSNTLPTAYRPLSSATDVRVPMAQTNSSGTLSRIFVGQVGGAAPGQVQLTGFSGNYIGTYSAHFEYPVI